MAREGIIPFLETGHLIKKEDLFKRWIGATKEEIVCHIWKKELKSFVFYKGPINGTIWCRPGKMYIYIDSDDEYDFALRDCDYFTIEDVEKCEKENPEYTGNITPDMLGLNKKDCFLDRVNKQKLKYEMYDVNKKLLEAQEELIEIKKELERFKDNHNLNPKKKTSYLNVIYALCRGRFDLDKNFAGKIEKLLHEAALHLDRKTIAEIKKELLNFEIDKINNIK